MSTSREIQLFSNCLKHASQRWRIPRSHHHHHHNSFPPLMISLSYYPTQTHPNDVFPWVDRIQVMTYGLSRPPPPAPPSSSSSSSSLLNDEQSHHQRLLLAQQQATEQAVRALINDAHCPPGKIWLGVPLYTQAMTTTTTRKNQPSLLTFSEAMASYSAPNIVDDRDKNHHLLHHIQQYLHEVLEGYQWESLEVMTMKRDLVHQHSLGGLFVWELGQDAAPVLVPGKVGDGGDGSSSGRVFPGGVGLTTLSRLCSGPPPTVTTSAPLGTTKLGQHPTSNDDFGDDDTKESSKNEL
jgi:Glycosyl hydrolases family 18